MDNMVVEQGLVASILYDPTCFFVSYPRVTWSMFSDPKLRTVYRHIQEHFAETTRVPDRFTLATLIGNTSVIPGDVLRFLTDLYDNAPVDTVEATASYVHLLRRQHDIKLLVVGIDRMRNNLLTLPPDGDVLFPIEEFNMIAGQVAGGSTTDPHIKSIFDDGSRDEFLQTRIRWLDTVLGGGLPVGYMVAVQGPPKGGKTTMLANIALWVAVNRREQERVPTMFISLEGDRRYTAKTLNFMLVTRIWRQHWMASIDSGRKQDALMLENSRNWLLSTPEYGDPAFAPAQWHTSIADAWHGYEGESDAAQTVRAYARQVLSESPLYVFDTASLRPHTLPTITTAIRGAILNHGVRVVVLDYAQLVLSANGSVAADASSEYAIIRSVSDTLASLAVQHNISIIIAAQMSERGLREKDAGDRSASGTRGGGALVSSVAALFEAQRLSQHGVGNLQTNLRYSRMTAGGVVTKWSTHAPSGVILNPSFMPKEGY